MRIAQFILRLTKCLKETTVRSRRHNQPLCLQNITTRSYLKYSASQRSQRLKQFTAATNINTQTIMLEKFCFRVFTKAKCCKNQANIFSFSKGFLTEVRIQQKLRSLHRAAGRGVNHLMAIMQWPSKGGGWWAPGRTFWGGQV